MRSFAVQAWEVAIGLGKIVLMFSALWVAGRLLLGLPM